MFLRRQAQEHRRPSLSFNEDAVRAIERHNWPGNVRELMSAVRRAAIMCDGPRVTLAELGLPDPAAAIDGVADGADDARTGRAGNDLDLRAVREVAERQAVLAALARTDSNVAKAAELLGVSRPTLYDLMRRLAIQ